MTQMYWSPEVSSDDHVGTGFSIGTALPEQLIVHRMNLSISQH